MLIVSTSVQIKAYNQRNQNQIYGSTNTQNCSKSRAIETGRYNFETADSFAYLGSLVNGENNF